MQGGEQKPLWQCPKCGNLFVTANMWHSCGRYTLEDLFARSEPQVLALCKKFIALVQEICGEVRIIPQKTRLSIQARVRFTGCQPRKSYLQCGFWFVRRHDNPRFTKIEHIPPSNFVHSVRVLSESDFDAEFRDWIREAYQVGMQQHLQK